MPDMTNAEAYEVLSKIADTAKIVPGGLEIHRWDKQTVIDALSTALAALTPKVINGETSDGYHTFNELYHHRALLFSVIVNLFCARSWKSKKHDDGTMYDGMFIVGIETPEGQATYHYDIEPYWGLFVCRELETAPKWDGHTPNDAIERISHLKFENLEIYHPKTRPHLDENGHALCGCGGEPLKYEMKAPYLEKGHYLECNWCTNCVGPCETADDAMREWDTAHGLRRDA